MSAALHIFVPIAVSLDWLIINDRGALPWHQLWLLLPYPALWLVVVLARGATDGWVPYGFLLPENGTASLIAHIIVLICAVMIAGVLVWSASRLSIYPPAAARNGMT